MTASGSEVSPRERLRQAFESRYNFDVIQVVELKSQRGEFHRTLQMATKRVNGSLRGLAYFIEPAHLRRTRLLMIENRDRSDDFFIYLPALNKVRRINSSQRKDTFMGTDLTYEDFERRYVDDYEVIDRGVSEVGGERVSLVEATPKYESGYSYAIYSIAPVDAAILEIRYFRKGLDEPIRIQRAPRSSMIVIDGHTIPTVFEVENLIEKSRTDVKLSKIQIDPGLGDEMFSRSALEIGRPIRFPP